MFSVKKIFNLDWAYEDALFYMDNAAQSVKKNPQQIFLGCGSHGEQIITLGKNQSYKARHFNDDFFHSSIKVIHVERGGGATAHEPGQLVLYPVFDYRFVGLNVPQIVFAMEQAMLGFLKELKINGSRSPIGPGVFVDDAKIGFIGLRIKDHITSHGLAINLVNDAKVFQAIIPCGIKGLKVTSAKFHSNIDKPLRYYQELLIKHFVKCLFLKRCKQNSNYKIES